MMSDQLSDSVSLLLDRNNPETLVSTGTKCTNILIASIGNSHIRWHHRRLDHSKVDYWKTEHICFNDAPCCNELKAIETIRALMPEHIWNFFSRSLPYQCKAYVCSVVLKQTSSVCALLHASKLFYRPIIRLDKKSFMLDFASTGAWTTLGLDRLAGMYGAKYCILNSTAKLGNFKSGQNFLVIDGGTCNTYLAIVRGEIKGGGILPGLKQKYEGLRIYTPELPEVNWQTLHEYVKNREMSVEIFESDTITNLCAGILGEFQSFFNQVINTFLNEVGDYSYIVITGGDGELLYNLLTKRERSKNSLSTLRMIEKKCDIMFDPFLVEHGIVQAIYVSSQLHLPFNDK
mmetsp:Transcript_10721/g.13983  ORF Transcript_10721/g.13983 Transcript_10721/m.13983 type:complete len:346 (+) Transcript_10721:468-1505(+)